MAIPDGFKDDLEALIDTYEFDFDILTESDDSVTIKFDFGS